MEFPSLHAVVKSLSLLCICVCIHRSVCECMHASVYIHTEVFIYGHIATHGCVDMYAYKCTCIYVHTLLLYVLI